MSSLDDQFGINVEALGMEQGFGSPVEPIFDAQRAAEIGAETLHALFGADVPRSTETLLAGYESITADLSKLDRPVVGINVVDKVSDGITAGHVIAASRKIRGDVDGNTLSVWPKMYPHRNAAWWNKRVPSGISCMTKDQFFGAVLFGGADGLDGKNEEWEHQRSLLSNLITHSVASATEGATILDWLMGDNASIVSNGEVGALPRLDVRTFTVFPQHDRDLRDDGVDYGPSADVDGGQAGLGGWDGSAGGGVGFRRLMGPRDSQITA